jgi:hypothetical protein
VLCRAHDRICLSSTQKDVRSELERDAVLGTGPDTRRVESVYGYTRQSLKCMLQGRALLSRYDYDSNRAAPFRGTRSEQSAPESA